MADQSSLNSSIPILNPPRKRKRNTDSITSLRKPRSKPIECPVCLNARSPSLIHIIDACGCIYCVYCLREVFSVALLVENTVSNFPAMCCGRALDHDFWERHFTPQLRRAYMSKAEEMRSNEPLYCGDPKCRAFILEAWVKDGFGSCGKCKKRTCARKGCNRTRAEHLGVHTICPGDFETKELRELAEAKGWKRCPKCCVLTERTRGCDDIRCICRTEWCYKCGKACRGTKDICLCYPLRRPPRPAQLAPAQDQVQIANEIIIVHDEDHDQVHAEHDTAILDIKPSIEEIESHSASMFYPESNHTSPPSSRPTTSASAETHTQMSRSEAPSSRFEPNIMQELDDLAAPYAANMNNRVQRTADDRARGTGRNLTTTARVFSIDSPSDDLEDMLNVFDNYQDSYMSSIQESPIGTHGDLGTPSTVRSIRPVRRHPSAATSPRPLAPTIDLSSPSPPEHMSPAESTQAQAEDFTETGTGHDWFVNSLEEYLFHNADTVDSSGPTA